MLKQYKCKTCGAEFFAHSYYEKRLNGNSYCSVQCKQKTMFGSTNKSRTGQKHKPETIIKMKISSNRDEKHPFWKGDKVGYACLHRWVEGKLGKAKDHTCSMCKGKSESKRMEWANINGDYTRDLVGWKPMCRKCHVKYDMEQLGLKMGRPSSLSKREILKIYKSKEFQYITAEKFGISQTLVSHIKSGKVASGVTGVIYKKKTA